MELDGGERLFACLGSYLVVVFNEGTENEYCVVFGPGNVVVSDGLLTRAAALAFAESLMLADEAEATINDEPGVSLGIDGSSSGPSPWGGSAEGGSVGKLSSPLRASISLKGWPRTSALPGAFDHLLSLEFTEGRVG